METTNVEMSRDGDPFSIGPMLGVRLGLADMPSVGNFSGSPRMAAHDTQDPDAESSHHDRLKREAEGLFAAVTLLNGLEPLEDIDDLDVGQNHEIDSVAAQTVEVFLNRLRPSESGEGIVCSQYPLSPPCGNSFLCTSRDIKAHFRCCELIQDVQFQEPFYETLEVFLKRPESKARIIDLQRRCRMVRELPDVDDFLSQLEYLPTGGVKCQRQACAHVGAFEPTSALIKRHFWLFHCASLEGALRKIHSQLRRPETALKLANVLEKARSAIVPDTGDFFCRLDLTTEGFLKCGQPVCANGREFAPSNWNIKDHFFQHCSAGTAEIIEPRFEQPVTALVMSKTIDNALAQRHSAFTHSRLNYSSEVHSSGTSHYLETEEPSWEQLRVLRTLRAKFVVHHRQFLQRTAGPLSDELQELRRTCGRYADLLDTGLLTFMAIMNDESPSSLKEVFAFIMLSYAMVGAMQARGKSVDFCLSELEMQRWRSSLLTSKDRDAFGELISLLWPELNEQHECPLSSDLFGWYSNAFRAMYVRKLKEGSSGSPLRFTAERLLGESSSDESFRFSDWLNFPDTDPSVARSGRFDLVGSPCEASRIGSPSRPPHGNTTSPSEIWDTHPGRDKTGGNLAAGWTPTTALEQLQGLAQTVIFMQAISFLIFIGGMGSLLLHLSGSNQNCFSTGERTFSAIEIARFSRFLEATKYRILNRLCLDNNLSKFHPLFRATTKILEAGWLRTIRDVEKYLICVAKLFSDSRASYLSVVSKILDYSLDASRDERIDAGYLYRGNHQEGDDYSPEYVAKRRKEEVATFTEDTIISENSSMNFASGGDLHPSIETEESRNEGAPSGPYAKRRHPSETTTSSADDSHVYILSDTDANSVQREPPTPAIISRKCNVEGCDKVFTGGDSANSLARHKREKHSNRSSFICPIQSCGHTSSRLHNLRVHWGKKHAGVTMPEGLVATQSRGGGGVKRKRERSRID